MNNQWKNNNTINIPPPANNNGADCSILSITAGSELKVAVNEPINPNEGLVNQMINQGNKPLTTKTAIRIPQIKNQRLAFADMVLSTSALMTALSIPLTVSNKHNPITMRIMERISNAICVFIEREYLKICLLLSVEKVAA